MKPSEVYLRAAERCFYGGFSCHAIQNCGGNRLLADEFSAFFGPKSTCRSSGIWLHDAKLSWEERREWRALALLIAHHIAKDSE